MKRVNQFLFTCLFFLFPSLLLSQANWQEVYDFGVGSSTPSSSFIAAGSQAFFLPNTASSGSEPWVTDATPAGTQLLADVYAGTFSSFARNFTPFNGEILFSANSSTNGSELWATDGTPGGTYLKADFNPGSGSGVPTYAPPTFLSFGSQLLITADMGGGLDEEPYLSDGTVGGSTLLMDINPTGGSNASQYTQVGSFVLFSATNGTDGLELWRTNGTPGGTNMVLDINSGGDGDPEQLFPIGSGQMFFSADDGVNGRELWITDGTPGGTQMVADINPGPDGSFPAKFFAFGGLVYFYAETAADGIEVWVTNGTPGGTARLMDINPGASSSLGFNNGVFLVGSGFQEIGGNLYFIANDGTHGYELWRTDGTPGGTGMVVDLYPGIDNGATYNQSFTSHDGYLFYAGANDTSGNEVVISDGSPSNTQVIDLAPGESGGVPYVSLPRGFVSVGNNLLLLGRPSTDSQWRLYSISLSSVSFPVEWLDIQAHAKADGRVSIEWQTASETHNHYFTLEHMAANRTFEPIGQVPGQGTTGKMHAYAFTHHDVPAGKHQYRIRQTDFDGQSSLSKIVEVWVDKEEGASLRSGSRPNVHVLSLPQHSPGGTAFLYDVSGRLLEKKTLENLEASFDLTPYSSGNYKLVFRGVNGQKNWNMTRK